MQKTDDLGTLRYFKSLITNGSHEKLKNICVLSQQIFTNVQYNDIAQCQPVVITNSLTVANTFGTHKIIRANKCLVEFLNPQRVVIIPLLWDNEL